MLETPSPTDTSVPDLDLELQDIANTKTTEARATSATTEIPDKYKGKTPEELIQMHQNAERLISRHGNDLAQLRQSAAILAQAQATKNVEQARKQTPTTVEALLDNPDKAIEDVVANSPALRQIQESASRVNDLESKLAYGDFVRSYPKYTEDIANDQFLDWIKKNPVRVNLAHAADQKDFNSARALWDMWSEHQDLLGSTSADRAGTVRKAATVKSTPVNAGGEGRGKPVYSRAKLDELRMKAHDGDPGAMAKLADPEFNQRLVEAYAEKRVR
jgi:hypothetical protein